VDGNGKLVYNRRMKTTAERLKELRGPRSQLEMARLVGHSHRQNWENWENDRNQMPVNKAMMLADHFNITLDWIYRGKGEM